MNRQLLKEAIRDTLPIMAGYVVLGMGFGILFKVNGYGLLWSASMSLFIYAGSMQYVGISLITGGASMISTVLTTLMVNARHLFYGLSMIEKYKDMGAIKPYLIFGLTDETYSLVCNEKRSKEYYLLVTLCNQCYWVTGSILGSLLGSIITFNTAGIEFSLTALFITICVDQWRQTKNHIPCLIGLGSTALCLFIFGTSSFLIPSMMMITALLFLMKGVFNRVD